MPPRVLAIIAAYNEERFIGACLEHLFANGVEVYLCDNESTDRTVEIAMSFLGRGLRGIETLPRDGTYRWRQILARKQQLSAELSADWFLHLDPDEFPHSRRAGQTLAEALGEADAAGYNAVEFDELAFVATSEEPDHDHAEFRQTMRWYYPFAPRRLHRLIAWKHQPGVDLVASGGHQVQFPRRRISPDRLVLRHYLLLSREHAIRKWVRRRFDPAEVQDGWHGWRASLTASDVRLPSSRDLRFTASDEDLDSSSPRREHWLEWPTTRAAPAQRLSPRERPQVLCIVNRPNWAHDRKTRALTAALREDYQLLTRYQSEVTAEEIEAADLVLVYYWIQIEELSHLAAVFERVRDRLLLGVCSEFELDGRRRGAGLAMLATVPRAVFAVNLVLAKRLASLLRRDVFYTPNGVDTEFFQPAVPPSSSPLRVGWAGSLMNHGATHRGVQEFIAPAVAAVEGAELCLAAREDRWRNEEEMREFYQSLHVYVCASRSEGTPNPCLEAAACGVPVVTTAVGNMPEFIRDGENGFLVARDVDEIAARLRLLRDDPALRERMGRAARATATQWDWGTQATRYAAMFEALLANRVVLPKRTVAQRAAYAVTRSRVWRVGSRVAWRVASLWQRST